MAIDNGALWGNIFFLFLRRNYREIYYWQGQQEVDFIIRDSTLKAINVCWDLTTDSTRKREINGLLNCLSALNLKEGYIITAFNEENISENDKKVHIVRAWKWLLTE